MELFGSSKEDKATFRLIGETFVYSCRDVMDEVLQFEVLLSNGSSRTVYLLLSEMSPNRLTRKLNAVGIHFGFKKRVEADFREQFLQTLIETATRRELPLRQGWYQKDGLWDYCYPEEKTWKGVMRYV